MGDHSGESSTEPAPGTLVEVLPRVAVGYGDLPVELGLEQMDLGLVPEADRRQLATALSSTGSLATVGGGLGNLAAAGERVYRLSSSTQALLKAGGTLAVKDGANLGAIVSGGKVVAQARFIPVGAVSTASALAAIGPALAMVALQMTLNEISGLVRTNIALTTQVLTVIRHEQWAELAGLVGAVDDAVAKAREIGSVPESLWDTVAARKADLGKQHDLYRRHVTDHVARLETLDVRGRREFLQANAEAIVFDAYALLSTVKATTGYEALHAARARTAGAHDEEEARLVEVIARDARALLDSTLAETADLVASLTRELRIAAELPGSVTVPLMRKWRDTKAVSLTSARLLEAVEPLADGLRPPVPALTAPAVVCAPAGIEPEPYLRILRWFLEAGEELRCLGFADSPEARDVARAFGRDVIDGLGSDHLAATTDRSTARTLVVVTDRRVITSRTDALREQGELGQIIPLDQVRYVRVSTVRDRSPRVVIDLITRDENLRWRFPAGTDETAVDDLAAVLAESMGIPETEREELVRRGAGVPDHVLQTS